VSRLERFDVARNRMTGRIRFDGLLYSTAFLRDAQGSPATPAIPGPRDAPVGGRSGRTRPDRSAIRREPEGLSSLRMYDEVPKVSEDPTPAVRRTDGI
jgi:hypothetical protein